MSSARCPRHNRGLPVIGRITENANEYLKLGETLTEFNPLMLRHLERRRLATPIRQDETQFGVSHIEVARRARHLPAYGNH